LPAQSIEAARSRGELQRRTGTANLMAEPIAPLPASKDFS